MFLYSVSSMPYQRYILSHEHFFRGGSRAAATSKMERSVIIVIGFQLLTTITKRSILDAAAALDPPLLFDLQGCCLQQRSYLPHMNGVVRLKDGIRAVLLLYRSFCNARLDIHIYNCSPFSRELKDCTTVSYISCNP